MIQAGQRAMILAAGKGERMRPLTLAAPKPLIKVDGKSLIDYAVDALAAADVKDIIINVHYLPEQLEDWASSKPNLNIQISDEREMLLDTGGGIRNALPLLGKNPVFVLNGDGFWLEHGRPALQRLRESWRDSEMDCLLLTCELPQTRGFDGKGDFTMDSSGKLTRFRGEGNPLVYIGGYLVHPRLFRNAPDGAFSMNMLWDTAIHSGRLFGLEHHGLWLHVGTPAAVTMAESELRNARYGS